MTLGWVPRRELHELDSRRC